LPQSTATIKGHLARSRKNLRTTKPKQPKEQNVELIGNMEEMDADMNPTEEVDAPCDLFVGATIGENELDTLYNDLTGKFPIKSFRGNAYIFVAYAYSPNAIIVRAMKNRSDEEMLKTYKDVYAYLKAKGFKPNFNVSDNECSRTIKEYLDKEEGVKIQLVEPHNHRANAAERAIQTFKNHFIAGLSTVDKAFPLQLWDDLLQQAQITLNLLRKARINNKLSAYEILEGPFNFNKTPLAPPGTKAIIYNSPDKRSSWGVHGTDAYYVGPALEHYRCYKFFVPETRAYRIAQAAVFYPQHCKMPNVDPGDTIRLAAQDLIHALQNPSPKAPVDLEPLHNQALRDLSNIFQAAVKKTSSISEGEENTPPRVANQPSTSNDTTAPRVIRALPRIH
jgi:hypothetical protein